LGKGVGYAFGKEEEFYMNSDSPEIIQKMFEIFDQSASGITAFLTGVEGMGEEISMKQNEIAKIDVEKMEIFRNTAKNQSKEIRKNAYYGEITYLLQSEIEIYLADFGKTFDQFLELGKKSLISFWKNVPIINTEVELATERSENLDREISTHDIFDITSLSVAIPYCDVVVTEKYFTDLAIRKNLDKKYGTIILTNINGLIDLV
jgi:hypothetical protein